MKDPLVSAGDTGDMGLTPASKDPLERKLATHSSILAWEIAWTENPGGLQSMGSQSWTPLSRHNDIRLSL